MGKATSKADNNAPIVPKIKPFLPDINPTNAPIFDRKKCKNTNKK